MSGSAAPFPGFVENSRQRCSRISPLPPPAPLPMFELMKKRRALSLSPPKSYVPLHAASPSRCSYLPPKPEPLDLREDRQKLAIALRRHDAERIGNPHAQNRIVYDCDELNAQAASSIRARDGKVLGGGSKIVDRKDTSHSRSSHSQSEEEQGPPRPYYTPTGPDDDTPVFESRFEGGNLRRAIQVGASEFDLVVRPDLNTNRHTQWFYFSISNTRRKRYKLNLVNFQKPDSMYNYGMRPLIFSRIAAREHGIEWVRAGSDICYYRNQQKRLRSNNKAFYYTLSFSLEMKYDHDTIYLAYCYPYTYTDLREDLRRLEAKPDMQRKMRRRSLCKTIGGNECYLLTITDFASRPEQMKRKIGILITGRVHPGESNSSWMMRGFVNFLVGSSKQAKMLRDKCIFKVVPMLNPDGVINGNYRCSLAGVDLNRKYDSACPVLQPTIFETKSMLKKFQQSFEVVLCVDLHGHSRAPNVFMYGCKTSEGDALYRHERILPFLLWDRGSNYFSYKDCSFEVTKKKEACARVVYRNLFGILNSFTMEASFAGTDFGRGKGMHLSWRDLEEMGETLGKTLVKYLDTVEHGKALKQIEEYERKVKLEPNLFEAGGAGDDSGFSEDDSGEGEGKENACNKTSAAEADAKNGRPISVKVRRSRKAKKKFLKKKKAPESQVERKEKTASSGSKGNTTEGIESKASRSSPRLRRRKLKLTSKRKVESSDMTAVTASREQPMTCQATKSLSNSLDCGDRVPAKENRKRWKKNSEKKQPGAGANHSSPPRLEANRVSAASPGLFPMNPMHIIPSSSRPESQKHSQETDKEENNIMTNTFETSFLSPSESCKPTVATPPPSKSRSERSSVQARRSLIPGKGVGIPRLSASASPSLMHSRSDHSVPKASRSLQSEQTHNAFTSDFESVAPSSSHPSTSVQLPSSLASTQRQPLRHLSSAKGDEDNNMILSALIKRTRSQCEPQKVVRELARNLPQSTQTLEEERPSATGKAFQTVENGSRGPEHGGRNLERKHIPPRHDFQDSVLNPVPLPFTQFRKKPMYNFSMALTSRDSAARCAQSNTHNDFVTRSHVSGSNRFQSNLLSSKSTDLDVTQRSILSVESTLPKTQMKRGRRRRQSEIMIRRKINLRARIKESRRTSAVSLDMLGNASQEPGFAELTMRMRSIMMKSETFSSEDDTQGFHPMIPATSGGPLDSKRLRAPSRKWGNIEETQESGSALTSRSSFDQEPNSHRTSRRDLRFVKTGVRMMQNLSSGF